jgi:IMP dehydrogenase
MTEQFLTFDDVLIVPSYSNIESRQEIETSVDVLDIPIVSANMDFVTGPAMAIAMNKFGGLGILHRFWSSEEEYISAIKQVVDSNVPLWFSVGIRDLKKSVEFVKKIANQYPVKGVCIDVAHGYHQKVADLIELIKGHPDNIISDIKVIAGNVASPEGTMFLQENGADGVKIGIGAGSVCTTRTVAGVGVPQWSAILECGIIKEDYPELLLIADGGIRFMGARHDGTFGMVERPKFKRYRGQASFGSNGDRYVKEGIEGLIPYKGPVEPILQDIKAGLQSSMSYVGSRTLSEFKEDARFAQVSSHTLMENNTRVKER